MQTEIINDDSDERDPNKQGRLRWIIERQNFRKMGIDIWLEKYGSSTLRRARRLGGAWMPLYKEERVAWEFGWPFHCIPRSRVIFGDAMTEGDCAPVTEAQWLAERYLLYQVLPGDQFEFKYIQVSENNKVVEEGLGLICRKTSATFIGEGNIVFCFITKFQSGSWTEARNPC